MLATKLAVEPCTELITPPPQLLTLDFSYPSQGGSWGVGWGTLGSRILCKCKLAYILKLSERNAQVMKLISSMN